jgi:hypothetical protein
MPITKVISDEPFICAIAMQREMDDGIVKINAVSAKGDVFVMQADEMIDCAKGTKIVVNKFQEISDSDGERRVIRPIEWHWFSRRRTNKVFRQRAFPHTTMKQRLQSAFAEIFPESLEF